MTDEKKKALELIEKMNISDHKYANSSYTMTDYQCMQCAIVLVNELIDVSNDNNLLFWHKVIIELEEMLVRSVVSKPK